MPINPGVRDDPNKPFELQKATSSCHNDPRTNIFSPRTNEKNLYYQRCRNNADRKCAPWMVEKLQLPASHDALDFPPRATCSEKHFIGSSWAGNTNHFRASVFLGRSEQHHLSLCFELSDFSHVGPVNRVVGVITGLLHS